MVSYLCCIIGNATSDLFDIGSDYYNMHYIIFYRFSSFTPFNNLATVCYIYPIFTVYFRSTINSGSYSRTRVLSTINRTYKMLPYLILHCKIQIHRFKYLCYIDNTFPSLRMSKYLSYIHVHEPKQLHCILLHYS